MPLAPGVAAMIRRAILTGADRFRPVPREVRSHTSEKRRHRERPESEIREGVADSKNLPERPDNQTLLKLYALFKQASSGDVEGKRPGFTDMVGRAKWDAWNEMKGTGSEDAMKQYIALIEDLKG